VTMANQGFSPRLSSKLEQYGGWDRLLNPPRPGSQPDRVAAEVKRLLDVLRPAVTNIAEYDNDVVVVGSKLPTVAIVGRFDEPFLKGAFEGCVEHWLEPAGVVGEQAAIVAYVLELREGREPVAAPLPNYAADDAIADLVKLPAIAANMAAYDPENDPA
jgi:hypothetical protein